MDRLSVLRVTLAPTDQCTPPKNNQKLIDGCNKKTKTKQTKAMSTMITDDEACQLMPNCDLRDKFVYP